MTALGIDTSNYTTSVALYNGINHKHLRKILDVKEGMRGIRQSDGVFIHNRELPELIGDLSFEDGINCVGVSVSPRNVQGSYMPVFTVGHGYAQAIASVLGVKLYKFSHQDGHIMAGIYSADAQELLNAPFISVHISGGTTEILKTEFNGYSFENEIIGGTLDISVGQLIDRIGVKMGIKFPCGKELEALAGKTDEVYNLPFSIKGGYFNLSGIETKLNGMVDDSHPKIARTVLHYISELLIKSLDNVIKNTGLTKILVVGGVASNLILREQLTHHFESNIYWGSSELSSDNAVGIAVLAHMAEERK